MHTNRLARETSPYLLQHQHNPVDWYPWGEKAFAAARAQNKPIFLSVGYSTCYWCHVMERQCFESEVIAAEMNARFINVKVDREERPDVDQLYMTAVQILTRHGGWPMSVFLTPDLRPFYGGTYFPPADMHGRPGFVSVLRGIESAYRDRPSDVEQTASQLTGILRDLAEPERSESLLTIDQKFIDYLIDRSTGDYDPALGGFGQAPKFPRETLLELLLQSQTVNPKPKIDQMLRHALDAMAHGGIRDQLGGGFHRYSTDAKWLVPHFEIMLYDNALLGWCYVEAYRQTEDLRYAAIARGVFDFVLREMTSKDGAFYTAMDAEVDGQEGLNYLWTADEIVDVLGGDDAKLFSKVYGVDRGPNFADPHHPPPDGRADKNILYLADPKLADEMHQKLEPMRRKLKSVREARKQPLLDTKIITSWNALMIRALAYGGQVLNEPRYTNASAAAADYLLRHHRTPDGGLFRTARDGVTKYDGFLDDYAFLIQALLAVREATGREEWKDHAASLAIIMLSKFEDAEHGGFYFTEESAKDLIVRQKVASDSPLPSGNAVAAMALLELDQPEAARRVLETFAEQTRRSAESMSSMVQAMQMYVSRMGAIEVASTERKPRRPASPEQIAADVVSVAVRWRSAAELEVQLSIADGYHINTNSSEMTATSLTVANADDDDVLGVEYPKGVKRRFAFADTELTVYEGEITILIELGESFPRPLKLRLTYQACTDDACLPPITKQFEAATPEAR